MMTEVLEKTLKKNGLEKIFEVYRNNLNYGKKFLIFVSEVISIDTLRHRKCVWITKAAEYISC